MSDKKYEYTMREIDWKKQEIIRRDFDDKGNERLHSWSEDGTESSVLDNFPINHYGERGWRIVQLLQDKEKNIAVMERELK